MKNLLVIVDMVNGFVNFGALSDKNINKITPNIVSMVKELKNKGYQICAFRDCHNKNDKEFEIFPEHCLCGSKESELIPELKCFEKYFDFNIKKNTTNGFVTKEFLNLVKNVEFDKVIVCGCCTDICVLNFVESYLKFIKANNLKTKICVVNNACYTFNGENHNANYYHNLSIEKMQNMGAYIKNYERNLCK